MKSTSFSGGGGDGKRDFDDIITAQPTTPPSTTIEMEASIDKSILYRNNLHQVAYTEDAETFECVLKHASEIMTKFGHPTLHENALKLYINAPDKRGRTPLHYLAMKKNIPMIETLAKYAHQHPHSEDSKGMDGDSYLDLTLQDSFGGTALHYASSTYKYLSQKPLTNLEEEMDEIFENIFNEALQEGDCLSVIMKLHKQEWQNTKRRKKSHMLERFPSFRYKYLNEEIETFRNFARKHLKLLLSAVDENGNNLLHLSSNPDNNHLSFMLLLQLGADPMCQNNYGETILHIAALNGNMLIAGELLKARDERTQQLIFMTDRKKQTALNKSILRNHVPISKLLLELGSKELVYMKDVEGYHAFHYAVAVSSISTIECICDHMTEVNHPSTSGHTPMHGAARLDSVKLIEWMINSNRGFNVNARDREKMTPLLTAAHFSSFQSFVLLYQHPATDRMAENNKCMNSLHIAILAQSHEIVQYLVSKDECASYINNMTIDGETAFEMAANSSQHQLLQLLLTSQLHNLRRRTKQINHLNLTAKKARASDLELFLRGGVTRSSPHLFDENQSTPLVEATKSGNIANVTLLLKVGVYADEKDRRGLTALGYCCIYDLVNIASVLVTHGASIEPSDSSSLSPLQIACEHDSPKMVKFLIEQGASVSYKGERKKNALEIAAEHKHKESADVIIQSDKWKVAMRSFHYDEDTSTVTTPMRMLIAKLPESALLVMDRCVWTPRDQANYDGEYHVEMDMEFLDDSYTSSTWETMSDFGELALTIRTNPCFNDEGLLHKDLNPYITSQHIVHDNHPLNVIIKQRELKLLEHPLVRGLTNYKWRNFGRILYYTYYILNLLYVACLTTFILKSPLPQSVIPNYDKNCFYLEEGSTDCKPGASREDKRTLFILRIVFLILAAFNIGREILQFKNMKFKYFLQLDNIVEIVGFVCVMLASIPADEFTNKTGILNKWQWSFLAVGLICGYLMIALESRKLPIFGIYIIMVGDIIRSFAKAFLILSEIVIGFGLFFYMIFGNEVPYTTWYLSLVKMVVMMVGELDYEGDFFLELGNRTESNYLNDSMSTYQVLQYVGFLGFIFLVPIIIMNLLIGLAVDDIKSVMENAKMKKLMKRMDMSLSVEYLLLQRITRRFQKATYELHPLKHKGKLWNFRILIFPEVRSIFGSIKERKESVEAEQHNKARKKASTDVLLNKLNEIQQQNVQIEERLKRLEEH